MAEEDGPNYDDKTDFENANRGFIPGTSLDDVVITTPNGRVVWDNRDYEFIEGATPETVNKSLWRQSKLCCISGLFKVKVLEDEDCGIYQVRGADLSNITFVETDSGVIVIDPLISQECVEKAMDLYNTHRPGRTVKALIYTHSHSDHYAGAGGVPLETGVPIIAPDGFLNQAISENIYVGNAMVRRATYMYGDQLPKKPTGQVGTGLGMTSSTGNTTLIAPTEDIKEKIGTKSGPPILRDPIDGLHIEFQLTPGTEAPAEMNFYFPKYKALCMAENVTHTMHNIQTLRGALVRNARVWSRYIDEAMEVFGDSDVVFSSHHWPTWGKSAIHEFMAEQRDLYAYLHDQTLRMLNNGQTGIEIAEDFKLPPSLKKSWSTQGYYGSVSHNVKAIYHRYMGWFDGNPAHLWEWPPVQAGKFYVDAIGGLTATIDKAKEFEDEKNLRFAATLLSHAVFSEEETKEPTRAKEALQRVFEKLGYGCENGPWRNFYLQGARELKHGVEASDVDLSNFDSMMALSLEQLMDSMAIRLDGPSSFDDPSFVIEWNVKDLNEAVRLTFDHATLTNRPCIYRKVGERNGATLSVWLSHRTLVKQIIEENPGMGGMLIDGDLAVWIDLKSRLVVPNNSFAIVTPGFP